VKVTGYQLQSAIKELQESRDLLQKQFEGSLHKFEDEKKRDPIELASEIERYERRIADLQAAQGVYNARVNVSIEGQQMTLLSAVKQVGGANRIVNLWKGVAGANAKDADIYGYSRRERMVRSKEQEVAKETVSADKAIELVQTASKRARALRSAIQFGNAVEIDLGFSVELA
jgi:hypothetical protein